MAAKAQRWTSCNVIAPSGEGRTLWHFSRKGEAAALDSETAVPAGGSAPAALVQKTLRQVWQPRLNIAWLPADKVFLRVVELPPGEAQEIPALLEFQIERLTPIPANQAVWTFEIVSIGPGQPTVVILMVADRAAVEQQLEALQGAGYRADRLELACLRELLAQKPPTDGVVLVGEVGAGQVSCLSAWWSEGRLRHVAMARLADAPQAGERLVDALRRTAWAAEVEGWRPSNLAVRLLADPALATRLAPPLQGFAAGPVDVRNRLAPGALAAVTAVASAQANLVPPDLRVRYRQEFVDRLWMRALGAVALVYLFGVLGYLAWLSLLDYQKGRVDHQIALQSASFAQAQQLKARAEILQEQVNLKFAALDCWKAAAEALPESLTLNTITFQRGKKLGLMGSVPLDLQGKVTEYNEALTKASVGGRPLFSKVTTKSITAPGAGRVDQPATWSLECEINRRDLP